MGIIDLGALTRGDYAIKFPFFTFLMISAQDPVISLSGKFYSQSQSSVAGSRPVVIVSWESLITSESLAEEYIWDPERDLESIVQELTGSLFGLSDVNPNHYTIVLQDTCQVIYPVRFFVKSDA